MLDNEILRERFEDLLDQQRQSVGIYASLASAMADPKARAEAEQIHRDKKRHIELTERLLEIVD